MHTECLIYFFYTELEYIAFYKTCARIRLKLLNLMIQSGAIVTVTMVALQLRLILYTLKLHDNLYPLYNVAKEKSY